MPLVSKLFTQPVRDPRLEGCLVEDSKHILQPAIGDHVKKIQTALNALSTGRGRENFGLKLDGKYGPITAAAVLAYKAAPQRRILGPGQTKPDNIVGKRTIKSLDDEMDILENELPSQSSLISSDVFGALHDHSRCARPETDGEIQVAPDGTMSHFATPMNPLGFGLKINIGGAKEVDYLGFRDTVPDPRLDPDMKGVPVNGRLLTSAIPRNTVSDISFRSAPVDRFMRTEIPKLCAQGARLTFVATSEGRPTDLDLILYFQSIGIIEQSGRLIEKSGQAPNADSFFVIVSVTRIVRPGR
jgi:peptidoglycan hydrolase-like protein with peptidoglycan-binding domain